VIEMAAKKKTDVADVVQNTEPVLEPIEFSKEQILTSVKYRNNRDLVDALLDEKKKYTMESVDNLIENYMKGKVE